MKVKTRKNTKINVWECKFEENDKWYIAAKELDQDKVFEYKYRVLKYKVNRIMNALQICDFDVYPFASELKTDLGFDKNEHNAKVVEYQGQAEFRKKQEVEKKKEEERLDREAKKKETELKSEQRKKEIEEKAKSVHSLTPPTAFELSVRKDILSGMTKKQIKKRHKISNAEYRNYKKEVSPFY